MCKDLSILGQVLIGHDLLHMLGVSTAVVKRLDGVVFTPLVFSSHLTLSVIAYVRCPSQAKLFGRSKSLVK